ncbi:MAG: hypothetical protein D4R97_08230 [Bacteroidetes bacterium]|nr:MAG: hypothetical protein D4R97_08230 [Bacteroidota bacterium]
MAANATLTLHVVGPKGIFRFTKDIDAIDLKFHRPIDVIQRLYQAGKNVSNPGGTTIWKMGKCVSPPNPNPVMGDVLDQVQPLAGVGNTVGNGNEIVVFEETLPVGP